MKRTNFYVVIFSSLFSYDLAFAATPTLEEANRLFDFAETVEPTLFFPPEQTQQILEAGTNWFFRYYTGSNVYVAVNVDATAFFSAGSVYVLGESFGEEPLFVDTLENLLAAVDSAAPPASGGMNAITNQGNGMCVERKFPAQNDTALFKTSTFSAGATATSERSEFYELVSNNRTITVIETTTTANGIESVTSNRVTRNFESNGGLFFELGSDSVSTTTTAGSTSSSVDTNIGYSPSLFIGPADSLCEGQTWFATSVTQTTIDSPDQSQNGATVNQTPALTGIIDAIGESVSVAGGTFSTIKTTLTYPDSRKIIWRDLEFGVVVMSETYIDNSESPSIVEELLLFDLPF